MDLVEVLKAADQAARWHADQRRKGAAAEPYVNHLVEVACLVAEAAPGDAGLVIAALLHDSIEDCSHVPVTRGMVASKFGERVAAIVMEVTDDKSLPKATRKALQLEHAAAKSPEAKLIKLADKTSNLRALASSPPADWPAERISQYIDWATRVVDAGLRDQSEWLEREFEIARRGALQAVAARA